ncbi:hypothetical protein K488DRAFT_74118 [Vararia minispora EC-137]|uniref:Uncharacterized protein n=1 Tax=Vararia minispora EC-137 TaxID=1314806 RepID=A0ACB8Q8H1_9AGAM|nr:hypothetical protein K488DRAFT_74118 [Vararia minispora EC-137]
MAHDNDKDGDPFPFLFHASSSRTHLRLFLTEGAIQHILIFPAQHGSRLTLQTVTLDTSTSGPQAMKDLREIGVLRWEGDVGVHDGEAGTEGNAENAGDRGQETTRRVPFFQHLDVRSSPPYPYSLQTPKRQKRALTSWYPRPQSPSPEPTPADLPHRQPPEDLTLNPFHVSPTKSDSSVTEPESETGSVHYVTRFWAQKSMPALSSALARFSDIKDLSLIEHISAFYATRGTGVPRMLLCAAMACEPVQVSVSE